MHHSIVSSLMMVLYDSVRCYDVYFNVVMKILKKYYSSLCHSLPADYNKSIAVLNKMGYCPTYVHALAKKFKAFGSSLKARQYLLDSLILTIDCEEAVLDICDLIDWMVEDDEMKHYIESFRNGIPI